MTVQEAVEHLQDAPLTDRIHAIEQLLLSLRNGGFRYWAECYLHKFRNGRTCIKQNLRLDILKLYSTDLEFQDLLGLKQILADFFARKAISEADQIWNQQNLSNQVMESWLDEG